jgi:hypothetical protein
MAVAAVGTVGAGSAWDDWALLLGVVLGRCATAGMIAAIASVPFWEDSDAAPLLFGAAAGFVARSGHSLPQVADVARA